MSLPRISLHIGDYKKDTSHLRAAGHGAYFLLMLHYYATGGLPNDDRQLAAIACMSDREWKEHKPVIKALFKAGDWKHKRIEEELVEAQAKYERRLRAGQKGNAKRWASHSDRNATAKPSQPITDNHIDDGGDDARARKPMISPEAHALAVEVAAIAGYPDPQAWPPGWCGASLRVQMWINEGWPREVVLAACRESMGRKRDGPPNSIKYFEKAVARAVAEQAQPVPRVIVEGVPEVIHAQANQHQPDKSALGAIRRIRQQIEDAAGDRGEAGGNPVRSLSQG